jgi:hypothetical protein
VAVVRVRDGRQQAESVRSHRNAKNSYGRNKGQTNKPAKSDIKYAERENAYIRNKTVIFL